MKLKIIKNFAFLFFDFFNFSVRTDRYWQYLFDYIKWNICIATLATEVNDLSLTRTTQQSDYNTASYQLVSRC
jgi:hypothetical protein